MTSTETRADRFARELTELKISDPSAGRSGLWLKAGVVLMICGPALALVAFFLSHNTSDALVQRDAIIVALIGIAVGIMGSAVYLRYSITGFLRFWMARQAYDFAELDRRITEQAPPS
ncbi:hypothetical protein [Rhodococcus rhodochrous]|uniref:hypothetical protein n=1 Tax=Rhodococcus rhodochrous TaxID=1829 RepID=UPI00031AA4DE|nr:hypothetical protein [Rhodococcus rhodochrous]